MVRLRSRLRRAEPPHSFTVSSHQNQPLTPLGLGCTFLAAQSQARENIPIDFDRILSSGERVKKSQWILGLVVLSALAGLFAYEQHLHPFRSEEHTSELQSL